MRTLTMRLAIGFGVTLALLSGAGAMYLGTPRSGKHPSVAGDGTVQGESSARETLSAGPEPLLANILADIEQGNIDAALKHADTLIEAYPKFRLGHLIKGDLLLARTRPLSDFGDGAHSTSAQARIADLRDEAIARLNGYRTKPPADTIPSALAQLSPIQKHALVVDTQRSRLYVYENDNGLPRLLTDFYVTQGKLGADKFREGDKRTPLGVYHVTAELPRDRLADLYGTGAFPLNYPNEFDKRQGRGGSGIWLHGTMSETFSRPPKASDGCVVLPNKDLDAIAGKLQVGQTPVIISDGVEWLPRGAWTSERQALLDVVEQWRQDWESRDVDRYARHYSHRFQSDRQDYAAWIDQKRRVNAGKEWIKVAANNLSVLRTMGKDNYMVATFDQDYQSNNLTNSMRKRQYWVKEEGRWKIIYEGGV